MAHESDRDTSTDSLIPLCHIVTPCGMLGYGFLPEPISEVLEKLTRHATPTALVLDSGSTDSGPSKLALGSMTCPLSSYKRDLGMLISLSKRFKIPLIFSSAGGDGTGKHVDDLVEVVREIIETEGESKTKIVAIYADIEKALVHQRLNDNKITGCGSAVPILTEEDIQTTTQIVAQMGPEAILSAMHAEPGFDIIVAGRAYDPSIYVAYAAFCASRKQPLSALPSSILGGYTHMGKILECGGLCAVPKCSSAMATVYTNGSFDITPLDPASVCTSLSVAAHTMYEKSRPDLLAGPGGTLDLTKAVYIPLDDGCSVRVRGADFITSQSANQAYTVKLEGARTRGYSSIFMGSIRDPILISQLGLFLPKVEEYVEKQHRHEKSWWKLNIHRYGNTSMPSIEVFLVGEALAQTQALATSLVSSARIACVHGPYKGQKATSGNFAMGLGGKLEIETGPRAEFCVYHLMELEPGEEGSAATSSDRTNNQLFSWKVFECGSASRESAVKPAAASTFQVPREIESRIGTARPLSNNLGDSKTLGDIATLLRSKNAGPYEITIDVMFSDIQIYHIIKESGILGPEIVSNLYELELKDIIYCGFFDQALAWKVTMPRQISGVCVSSGSYLDDDVHGSSKYLPILNLSLPNNVKSILSTM